MTTCKKCKKGFLFSDYYPRIFMDEKGNVFDRTFTYCSSVLCDWQDPKKNPRLQQLMKGSN